MKHDPVFLKDLKVGDLVYLKYTTLKGLMNYLPGLKLESINGHVFWFQQPAKGRCIQLRCYLGYDELRSVKGGMYRLIGYHHSSVSAYRST